MRWLAALLWALPWAGLAAPSGAFMTGDHADYKTVRGLQQKAGRETLPAEGSQRPEMLLALADVAAGGAAGGFGGANFKSEDYDALYALLQKYRDELKALGLKAKSMEDLLAELRRSQDEQERRLKNLAKLNFDGLKIHGSLVTQFEDEAFSGPGSKVTEDPANPGTPGLANPRGTPFRFRTMKQTVALKFSGARGPISALAILQNDFYFGGAATNKFSGLTRLEAELRLPVVIQAGDLHAHMTPLTLWRNEDASEGEPEPFAARRQRHRDDLFLKGPDMNLRGMRLHTDLVLMESQAIHIQGLVHGIGFDRTVLYYLGGQPPNAPPDSFQDPSTANAVTNGRFHTYLGAWQAETTLVGLLDLGYAGTMMRDATDSNGFGYLTLPAGVLSGMEARGYDSQVHSVSGKLRFLDDHLQVGVEAAHSLYNNPNRPDFHASTLSAATIGYLTGTALVVRAEAKADWFSLEADYRHVDRTFISAPAQGRSQDANYLLYGPFMHENIRFNPATSDYSAFYLWTHIPDPVMENFNAALLPPQLLASPSAPSPGLFIFNYLLPYNAAVNAGSPYGQATPNRNGVTLRGSLKLFGGALKPWARGEALSENSRVFTQNITRTAEQYGSYDGGVVLDLEPRLGWPVSFSGSYGVRSVKSDQWVNFSSTLYSGGAQARLNPKTVFHFGMQHTNFQGTLAYPLYGGYGDPISGQMIDGNFAPIAVKAYAYEQSYDIWSLGLRYELNDQCTLSLDYGTQYFWDVLAEKNLGPTHYQMDQGNMRLQMQF